jgi:hypothetical protein
MRLKIGVISFFMLILVFVVDGTNAQVTLVRDIKQGADSSSPSGLTVVGDTLFFAADDGKVPLLQPPPLWQILIRAFRTVPLPD